MVTPDAGPGSGCRRRPNSATWPPGCRSARVSDIGEAELRYMENDVGSWLWADLDPSGGGDICFKSRGF